MNAAGMLAFYERNGETFPLNRSTLISARVEVFDT